MNEIEKFLKAFSILLKADKYISRIEIDSLFLNYKKILDNNIEDSLLKEIINNKYKIIEIKNERFINKKLIEYKDYFDNMFKGIDDSIILDEEQRRAILIDEDYSLVIAGAGSGKTTTMAAKVKYLVDKKHIKEDKIILLAFTNKACEELKTRINDDFKLNVEVLTFHKLGMKFLRQIFNEKVQIISDGTFNKIAEEYITKHIFENKERLKEFSSSFKEYVKFDDKCFSFKTYNEYYDYFVNKTYEENKQNLEEFCIKNIKNRLSNHIGITGEKFKTAHETKIANYLYINSVDYQYGNIYPHKLSKERKYYPLFTITNNIYIEYYELINSQNGIDYYRKIIIKKRKLHENYSTDLIELYSTYDYDTDYIKELSKSLDERFVKKIPKTIDEIFNEIMYSSKERIFYKIIGLFESFITTFKEKGSLVEDFDYYINKAKDDTLKSQLKFLKDFYLYYEDNIHSNNKIDFSDMINYAYKYTSKLKNKNIGYDYIIIDEYQDISSSRYNFAKRISDLFNAKIVAVGDDWQAIYSFSGSDVELFTDFYNKMGYAEIIKIQKTYRNSQELLDIASEFVSKDASMFNKKLTSNKHLDKPVEIFYYDTKKNNKIDCVVSIIEKIYKEKHNSKILIIGRFNKEKDELINSELFTIGVKDEIICKIIPNAKIDFLTVHSSKGLGYDQVIILNGMNDKYGFPSLIEDEEVIKVLKDDKDSSDKTINYPEERRLFYVALTRTKNKVYILCPYLPMDKRSEFIREIEENKNVKKTFICENSNNLC